MKIYIEREEKEIEVKVTEISVVELLKKLKINKSTVIVARNDELVGDHSILKNKDVVRILSVISGG